MTPEDIVGRLVGLAMRADAGEDVGDEAERFCTWVDEDRGRAGAVLGAAVGSLWATAADHAGIAVTRPVLRVHAPAEEAR
jgi:hypothetical protein